jgi:hypothetical protein
MKNFFPIKVFQNNLIFLIKIRKKFYVSILSINKYLIYFSDKYKKKKNKKENNYIKND